MKRSHVLVLLVALLCLTQVGAGVDVKGQVVLQNAAAANGNGTAIDVSQYPGLGLQVTITGTATVNFESSTDNQTTWNAHNCFPDNSTTGQTTATTSGGFQCNLTGKDHFRARISGYSSGSVTVTSNAAAVSAKSIGGGGGGGAGTVTTTGSPANTQVSFFTAPTTISGDTNLTWDNAGKVLALGTGNNTTITTAALTANRTFTLPDANSNPVQPDTGAANNYLTAISSAGVISKAQPTANQIVGTTTNDNATAGNIGEYITATVATASSIALTTNTTANITSISLTAGDWDVTCMVDFTFGATTNYTNLIGGVSTTSATLGGQDTKFDFESPGAVPTATADSTFVCPTVRQSLASTTTVYLVTQATFTVSTLKAYGTIRARRMR